MSHAASAAGQRQGVQKVFADEITPVNATFAQYQALEAIGNQISISGPGPWLFPNPDNPSGYQGSFKKVWATTLRKAGIPHFRIYDLRSTYAMRLSAGGVADEWVTQLLRQGDAKVFKRYSQMKLQMKREGLGR